MKGKKRIIMMYTMGFIIILTMFFLMCASELSMFNTLWSLLLIILSYIAMAFDINTKQIPNELIVIMIIAWLILIVPVLLYDMDYGVKLLMDSLLGLLIGGGMFLVVYIVSRKGLGGGDVKFMAAAGLYLGLAGTIPAILFGSVLAAITGLILIVIKKIKRKDAIPLVPFLFVGILITAFTG